MSQRTTGVGWKTSLLHLHHLLNFMVASHNFDSKDACFDTSPHFCDGSSHHLFFFFRGFGQVRFGVPTCIGVCDMTDSLLPSLPSLPSPTRKKSSSAHVSTSANSIKGRCMHACMSESSLQLSNKSNLNLCAGCSQDQAPVMSGTLSQGMFWNV